MQSLLRLIACIGYYQHPKESTIKPTTATLPSLSSFLELYGICHKLCHLSCYDVGSAHQHTTTPVCTSNVCTTFGSVSYVAGHNLPRFVVSFTFWFYRLPTATRSTGLNGPRSQQPNNIMLLLVLPTLPSNTPRGETLLGQSGYWINQRIYNCAFASLRTWNLLFIVSFNQLYQLYVSTFFG